jgi:hypothetical protein
MKCDKCGMTESDNDGPPTDCPECGRSLCRRCYGHGSFEWCKACRRAERKAKEANRDFSSVGMVQNGARCGVSDRATGAQLRRVRGRPDADSNQTVKEAMR